MLKQQIVNENSEYLKYSDLIKTRWNQLEALNDYLLLL